MKSAVSNERHTAAKRTKTYGYGDFYLYEIICSCGHVCGGWSTQEVEEEFNKHKKEKGIPPSDKSEGILPTE